MSSGLYNIGVGTLAAAQTNLRTTAHNVANAQTEGYSRQRVELETQTPLFLGGNYLGSGVKLGGITRSYDSFLVGQVRAYNSSYSQAKTFASQSGLVDQLLADSNVGMMPAVQSFFGAMQDVANDPSAITPRQALLNQAGTLVDRFHYLNQRFEEMRSQVNGQMKDTVAEINSYASEIADLNKQIVIAGTNNSPNDLLDRRDTLINKLSEKIAVTTVPDTNGAVNVFIGNGQPLVIGFSPMQLSVQPNKFDININEVVVSTGGAGTVQISNMITGGTLSGLLNFRNNVLDPAQDELGRLAMGFASTINAQHTLGQDLNGNLGTNFFQNPALQVLPATGAPAVVVANLSNATQLTGKEYMLTYNGGNSYTLIRNSDQQTTAINTGGASPYTTPVVDGFTLTLTAGAAAGDQFLIRPTRGGALGIQDLLADPRTIAAAAPIATSVVPANSGSGIISAGSVTSTANLPLPGNVTLTYNTGPNNFTVTGAVPGAGPIPYVASGTIAFNGLQFSISGNPANGDQFVIANNVGGMGDNRNVLLIAGLQTQRLLANGSETYGDTYGGLVSTVGIQTNSAQITEKAQADLLQQAQESQQAVSGVNLDEEAADLVRFQQLYQAAAQVITTANTIFQTLLSAVGR
ncbi:MAG: flagellar hook-associated protein FlgK [Gammaproteobacteria bacterium]|nr:flagellar hook-associated protein FlgK [Gammaproteobacteria bacterium]